MRIVIAAAMRTPIGVLGGAFATIPAHRLGAAVITAAIERARLAPEEVDEVILGQVLTAGQGQNPARQAAIATVAAGIGKLLLAGRNEAAGPCWRDDA